MDPACMAARQRGQSMTEYVIVFPVLLLLIFGALQFALIYQAKITLNYATFEAARVGALNYAQMNFIANALARGMAPLYTHDDTAGDVQAARNLVQEEISDGLQEVEENVVGRTVLVWRSNLVEIQRINPPMEAFGDFPVITDDGGVEIPNDNLKYRPDTTGGTSRISIQDANLLKIRVTYCYPLYVPFINRTIVTLMTNTNAGAPSNWVEATAPSYAGDQGLTPPEADTINASCLASGRLPIVSQAIVRMQTPAYCETC